MDIQEIKRRVDLLKQVTQQRTVLITDVAREMKVRQTNLMIFVNDNPKLFHTEEVWSWKKEPYYEHYPWGRVRSSRTVRDKCKGLGITEAYLRPEDNFRTDEFVALMQHNKAKTIWVSEWSNYGVMEGHYVAEDVPDEKDGHRYHLWRNTADKIRQLRDLGILYETTFYIGGLGDCNHYKKDTAITMEGADKARSLGWTVIGL